MAMAVAWVSLPWEHGHGAISMVSYLPGLFLCTHWFAESCPAKVAMDLPSLLFEFSQTTFGIQ